MKYRLIEMNDVFYPQENKPKNCPQPKSGEAVLHDLVQLDYLMNEVRRGVVELCWTKCDLKCKASESLRSATEDKKGKKAS